MSEKRTRPDKCDMVAGACACGAWHDNLSWDDYSSLLRVAEAARESRWILDYLSRGKCACDRDVNWTCEGCALHSALVKIIKAVDAIPSAALPAPGERKAGGCDIPPKGWRCTREKGHDGPCAAVKQMTLEQEYCLDPKLKPEDI